MGSFSYLALLLIPLGMEYGEVITDRDLIHELRDRLHQQLQLTNHASLFPGSQPVSFTASHLRSLCTQDYLVCEKSDGIRYLLYFCHPPCFGPSALLIDRNYSFRLLRGVCLFDRNGQIQEETLLDGELIHEEKKEHGSEEPHNGSLSQEVSFVIFDALLVNGVRVTGANLTRRLQCVQNDVISTRCTGLEFKLKLKPMSKPYHLKWILEEVIPNLTHGNDGLIFTPIEDPYQAGTCHRLLKWKPASLNTVDFKIKRENAANGRSYRLQVMQSGGVHVDYAELSPFPDDPGLVDDQIIECRLLPDQSWQFVRIRHDKLTANAEHVVKKILESIKDNVTKDQLIAAIPDIKRGWDKRHASKEAAKNVVKEVAEEVVKETPAKELERKDLKREAEGFTDELLKRIKKK